MRVAVRVDAGPLIGGGHAMRCLTLANALAERGAEVTFVTASMPETLRERIIAAGHGLVERTALSHLERTGRSWHEPPLGEDVQHEDATAAEAGVGSVDWVVVDHYLLDRRWHSAARRFASRVLVIDDLANRPCDCDLLLDQTLGRFAWNYEGLVAQGTNVLAGASYAALRPEFARERPAALRRRQESVSVRRILLSMGTTDPGGITATILEEVLAAAPKCAVDVVLGRDAPGLPRVRELADAHPNIAVHVDTDRVAELMRDADLAVGAAGTTSWERCCLGLPSIALVLAENQRSGAGALHEASAAVAVESVQDLGKALKELLGSPERLSRMSAAAFAIADGMGAKRVVRAMLQKNEIPPAEVELRRATLADAETLWLWRNDPVARAQSRNTDPVSWTEHVEWLTSALSDSSRGVLIAEQNGVPVGTVRLDRLDGEGADEISISVAPEMRGAEVGSAMLKAACAQADARIYASVRDGNRPARKLFESCGFKPIGSAEPGFLRYIWAGEGRWRKHA